MTAGQAKPQAEPNEAESDEAAPRPPKTAFEPDRVPVRGALLAAAGLLGGVVISALLVWGLFRAFDHFYPAAPVAPLAARPIEPPDPKLETTPLGERPLLDARAALELSRSRWLDAAHTRAQVPIFRAVELLAARGWPDAEGARP